VTHWPWEGEGKSSHGPTGQRGCAGRVGTASPGVLLVGSRVGGLGGRLRAPSLLVGRRVGELGGCLRAPGLLVGSRVGGLGGPLRAPGLLAVGDVGEEEALGWLPVQPSLMRW